MRRSARSTTSTRRSGLGSSRPRAGPWPTAGSSRRELERASMPSRRPSASVTTPRSRRRSCRNARRRRVPDDLEVRLTGIERAVDAAARAGDREALLDALRLQFVDLLESGQASEASVVRHRAEALIEDLRLPVHLWYPAMWRAMEALRRVIRRPGRSSRRSGSRASGGTTGTCGWSTPCSSCTSRSTPVRRRGGSRSWSRSWTEMPERFAPVTAYGAAAAGLDDRVAELVAVHAGTAFERLPRDLSWLYNVSLYAEAAAHIGDVDSCRVLAAQLLPWAGHLVVLGSGAVCLGDAGGFAGRALAAAGDLERGRRLLDDALAAQPRDRVRARRRPRPCGADPPPARQRRRDGKEGSDERCPMRPAPRSNVSGRAPTRCCSRIPDDAWATPTRCEGWSITDLVAHTCWGTSFEADGLRRARTGCRRRRRGRRGRRRPDPRRPPRRSSRPTPARSSRRSTRSSTRPTTEPCPCPTASCPSRSRSMCSRWRPACTPATSPPRSARTIAWSPTCAGRRSRSSMRSGRRWPTRAAPASSPDRASGCGAARGAVRFVHDDDGWRADHLDATTTITGDDSDVVLFALGRRPIEAVTVEGDPERGRPFQGPGPGP